MDALQKYLNPNKLKLVSKGVESVVSRVLNLKEKIPDVTHEKFCKAMEEAFIERWSGKKVNSVDLKFEDLKKID